MNNPESSVSTSVRLWQYWLPVALWLIIQFTFSTDSFSSDETSKYIVPLLKFLFRNLSPDQVEFWHHVVRKAAHVTEYCILGVLVYRAIHLDLANQAAVRMLTAVFVLAAAIADEFHQSFVATRTSSIFDIGFDCIGGIISLALVWLWRIARVAEE